MAVTLEQFRAAWADKPNRDKAYALAEQYAKENAATLDPLLGGMDGEDLVRLVDLARLAGDEDNATAITIYELVKFERQDIGGHIAMVVPPRIRPKDQAPATGKAAKRG